MSVQEARVLLDKDASAYCMYCGEVADTLDHLLPEPYTGPIGRAQVETVPACRQCNSILGPSVIQGIEARREFVHERLRSKNKALLAMQPFTDEDLAELGPTLRRQVRADMRRQRRLMARLAWPRRPSWFESERAAVRAEAGAQSGAVVDHESAKQ
jgi:hypothetical protein